MDTDLVRLMAHGHPTDEMLAAYAAGASSDGMALLIAAHLTYCPDCRRRVSALEAVSAAVFAETSAAEVDEALFGGIMAQLDAPVPAPVAHRAPADPVLPRPLAEAVGVPFGDIRWRFRMPGVSEVPLDLGGSERISLLRVKPGAGVPAHTHTGDEVTLVLQGVLCDRDREFGRGAVAVATPEDDHHPHAGGACDCICLTVMDGGLRFTGRFGRALNIFAE